MIIMLYPKGGKTSMKRIKRKEDEEGAMGVGTLIIFIAMVLVAAVAASVLIDTANQLQQQAQRTGDEAIREVSSSFQVQDAYGVNYSEAETLPSYLTDGFPSDSSGDITNGEIEEINMKIGLAAGANPQDLNQTILQVQTDDWEVNLEANNTELDEGASEGFPDSTHYAWEQVIIQEDETDKPFVSSGDLYKIKIDLTALTAESDIDAEDARLGTQDSVDINIIPKHGTPTYEELVTPSTITTKMVSL